MRVEDFGDLPKDLTEMPDGDVCMWRCRLTRLKAELDTQLGQNLTAEGKRPTTPEYRDWRARAVRKKACVESDLSRAKEELVRRNGVMSKRPSVYPLLAELCDRLASWEDAPPAMRDTAAALSEVLTTYYL